MVISLLPRPRHWFVYFWNNSNWIMNCPKSTDSRLENPSFYLETFWTVTNKENFEENGSIFQTKCKMKLQFFMAHKSLVSVTFQTQYYEYARCNIIEGCC